MFKIPYGNDINTFNGNINLTIWIFYQNLFHFN